MGGQEKSDAVLFGWTKVIDVIRVGACGRSVLGAPACPTSASRASTALGGPPRRRVKYTLMLVHVSSDPLEPHTKAVGKEIDNL
jgi:hypothetical protein